MGGGDDQTYVVALAALGVAEDASDDAQTRESGLDILDAWILVGAACISFTLYSKRNGSKGRLSGSLYILHQERLLSVRLVDSGQVGRRLDVQQRVKSRSLA